MRDLRAALWLLVAGCFWAVFNVWFYAFAMHGYWWPGVPMG